VLDCQKADSDSKHPSKLKMPILTLSTFQLRTTAVDAPADRPQFQQLEAEQKLPELKVGQD